MPVVRLVVTRVLLAIPLLFVVSALTFVLVALTPGDPAREILGANATASQVAALRSQLGLNQPLPVQYWHWVVHALHGNLGHSLYSSQAVSGELSSRLGVTLTIIIGATLLSTVLGVVLGVLSAVRGGILGRLADVGSLVGFAIPNFWLGLILVTVFSIELRIFPATGFASFGSGVLPWLKSIVLPIVTLSALGVTGIAKQTRDSMRDVLAGDFVTALRGEGIPERSIIFRHCLKNAALPVVTMVGLFFVGTLSGSVVVEEVFGLPGLGSLAVQSTSTHDIPVIQGVVIYFTLIVVAVNLILELSYGLLNPKAAAP